MSNTNVTTGVLRRAGRKSHVFPLNILAWPTHERYQQVFGECPHRFFLLSSPQTKSWNRQYAPVPSNTTILWGEKSITIPLDVEIDIILTQNKMTQYPLARQLADDWGLPLINLEHTLPQEGMTEFDLNQVAKMRGYINVFLSEYSRRAWKWPESQIAGHDHTAIIPPGIDTDFFQPRPFSGVRETTPHILSVVNEWIARRHVCGYDLWKEVTKGLEEKTKVVGDTPGLSVAAKDQEELRGHYQSCAVFLNTSQVSTCPFTLLEAMACGMAVVSTATTMIPEVIQDGVNGFCSNSPAVLRHRCEQLLQDAPLRLRLGQAARKTIEERFSFHRMAEDWNGVFDQAMRYQFPNE